MSLRLHNQIYNNENLLVESLITEALDIHSIDALYIPRKFVGKDDITGEDRLSKFKHAYPIQVYLETTEGFMGQGAFASKFGLMVEQSAHITIARRKWDQTVGKYGKTILPYRPAEGDLIKLMLPQTGLFEIMYNDQLSQFYQLGQLYVYKLTIELFRYSSEDISTGNQEVDKFMENKTTEIGKNPVEAPDQFGNNDKFKQRADDFVFNVNNPFGDI
jgi:hypothetical protein